LPASSTLSGAVAEASALAFEVSSAGGALGAVVVGVAGALPDALPCWPGVPVGMPAAASRLARPACQVPAWRRPSSSLASAAAKVAASSVSNAVA